MTVGSKCFRFLFWFTCLLLLAYFPGTRGLTAGRKCSVLYVVSASLSHARGRYNVPNPFVNVGIDGNMIMFGEEAEHSP